MKRLMAAAFGLTLATSPVVLAQRADRNVDQPVVRSLNWFSYVAAEDVRAACQPGGRSRLRLIYNALWEEQVRTYEVFLQPDGTAGLNIGVLPQQAPATDVSSITIGSLSDVTAPWRMRKGQRLLDAAQTA